MFHLIFKAAQMKWKEKFSLDKLKRNINSCIYKNIIIKYYFLYLSKLKKPINLKFKLVYQTNLY